MPPGTEEDDADADAAAASSASSAAKEMRYASASSLACLYSRVASICCVTGLDQPKDSDTPLLHPLNRVCCSIFLMPFPKPLWMPASIPAA